MPVPHIWFRAPAALLLLAIGVVTAPPSVAAPRPGPRYVPHVVVATLDTGTNPFHPVWRRGRWAHPSTYVQGYPAAAKAAKLRFLPDFDDSVEKSAAEIRKFGKDLVWVPGTNIVGARAHQTDQIPVFNPESATHYHGALASSQIAGRGVGTAPDALLVVLDRTPDQRTAGDILADPLATEVYRANAELLRWAADQPWIDIIHTNIQDPVPLDRQGSPAAANYPDAVAYAVAKGKLVVSAGGNHYAQPTEVSPHAGPPGVLVAGANDNCGYTDFSNLDPHVVMDGSGTVAADSFNYEYTSFGGTSSASPRVTGYVADLLLRLRRQYGYVGGVTADGALLTVPPRRRPAAGPLADGRLTAAELHEVVRKTANPRSHASKWDGTGDLTGCVPEVPAGPALYAKMGYGEVSEHTTGAAYDVAVGRAPMPSRPDEDRWYEWSEEARRRFWS